MLVLNEKAILSHVHSCLKEIKEDMNNNIGILEEDELLEILSNSLKNVMQPELAMKYLIIAQFCTKITTDKSVHKVHYFFPNLVRASRPANLWSTGEHEYTRLYIWCLKCVDGQFFTPLYLHTLFIQLVKFGGGKGYSEPTIWKNGILLVHSNGSRFVIEVTEQTTRLQLTMQCVKDFELYLVQQRSLLISLIKSLCSHTDPEEFLIHTTQHSYPPAILSEVEMDKVAKSIVDSQPFVLPRARSSESELPQHIRLSDLLSFDSFHQIDEAFIKSIFAHKNSEQNVPSDMLSAVCKAVSANGMLLESLQGEPQLTYSSLYEELHKYTIFPKGDLLVST